MVRLLTFRVQIAPGLELLWDEERPPGLQIFLEDDEHDRMCAAGAPEHWDYADVPVHVLIGFLFKEQPRRGKCPFGCRFSKPEPGQIRMEITYKGIVVAVRSYPESVYHEAVRLAGHAKAFGALCDAVARRRDHDFRRKIEALIADPPAAPAPAKTPPVTQRLHPTEAGPFRRPPRQGKPKSPNPPRAEPKRPVVRAAVAVPAGPLRAMQVRIYAESLGNGSTLPETLGSDAQLQIKTYAVAAGILTSSPEPP